MKQICSTAILAIALGWLSLAPAQSLQLNASAGVPVTSKSVTELYTAGLAVELGTYVPWIRTEAVQLDLGANMSFGAYQPKETVSSTLGALHVGSGTLRLRLSSGSPSSLFLTIGGGVTRPSITTSSQEGRSLIQSAIDDTEEYASLVVGGLGYRVQLGEGQMLYIGTEYQHLAMQSPVGAISLRAGVALGNP